MGLLIPQISWEPFLLSKPLSKSVAIAHAVRARIRLCAMCYFGAVDRDLILFSYLQSYRYVSRMDGQGSFRLQPRSWSTLNHVLFRFLFPSPPGSGE